MQTKLIISTDCLPKLVYAAYSTSFDEIFFLTKKPPTKFFSLISSVEVAGKLYKIMEVEDAMYLGKL